MDNFKQYLDRMAKSTGETSKIRLLDFIPKDAEYILDFGCADGSLTEKIAKAFPKATIIGYDVDRKKIDLARTYHKQPNIIFSDSYWGGIGNYAGFFDAVILSSVLHEIFSYDDNIYSSVSPFNYTRLDAVLSDVKSYLKPHGKLLIRDGVKDNRYTPVRIHFKEADGPEWLNRFKKEFNGLPYEGVIITKIDDMTYEFSSEDYAREFMYTYTWGAESWDREVKEQFGYYNEKEYVAYLEDMDFTVTLHSAFTELGYYYHLGKKLDFTDKNNNPIDLPYSTIFIVADKNMPSNSNTNSLYGNY